MLVQICIYVGICIYIYMHAFKQIEVDDLDLTLFSKMP